MLNHIQVAIAILFCINTTLAISFTYRFAIEKKPANRINIYVYALLLSSVIWSSGMGLMSLQYDDKWAYYFRILGILGTFIFMISVRITLCILADIPRRVKTIVNIFSGFGIPIYFLYARPDQTIFVHNHIGTTFYFKQGIVNFLYSFYFIVVSINILVVTLYMIRQNKYNRLKSAGKTFLIVEGFIFVGAITDMVMPSLGFAAYPGSAITHFWGVFFVWKAVHEMYRSQLTITNMSEYVYNSLDTPVLIFNMNHRLEILNGASAEFLRIPANDFTPGEISIDNLFKSEGDIFDFYEKSCSKKVVCNSSKSNCEISISKIYDSYNDIIGYICLINDLTDHEMVIAKLEQAKIAADSANLSKSLFLANMSHEIRTPMNAILGFSDIALSEDIDEKSREYFNGIKQAGAVLISVINQILDISKIESGRTELNNESYKPSKIINDVEIITQTNAHKKGLKFNLNIDPSIPDELFGDKNKIRDILLNLLGNAVKYTTTGTVELSGNATIIDSHRALIRFSVSDTGIGIKKGDLPTIFDKFSRIDARLSNKNEGTGLGLSITKGLIDILGGKIDVKSEYGVGTTFSVEIPQGIVDARSIQLIKTTNEQDSIKAEIIEKYNGLRFLAVDDNKVNLKVTSSFLKPFGAPVDTCVSGQEAIDLCKTNSYDIVFMDHMMPEMDGVEAMRRIRMIPGYERGSNQKIVVLTANVVNEAKEFLMSEGFDDFLSKPMSREELQVVLAKMIGY